ncbi:hypothetical protein HRR83_009077 [Exophiala dermatitidis]|uniref:DUF7728 domain-containing protein n=2 Tax=Exophiala dermatitidis TaxID=5970 RepID=H6BWT5_EXODN|nr:uncharacterized protein HMPREF1120_03419 [Exophiala dermatitidis NIH/UT8656]XP_009155737.1 hypothetical protein, variant [Exophiala dermatitidis NIH/UT8656]KAJ4503171.1 hypothetical protein HRR73_009182 [Exophiala dermatitidis]EHY55275.1 hypothetical protein, variant [Exophiala dermatitidis NIH/UT8656]EHY55276.1 hypothetical protein HMPREF1120_03419 [Exophiala dermatitidis NIH/UT8656]KAJ4506160.1 hypothetical protein HRR75_007015 [Exophiala dermatitidis]KAJ4508250.1 hypothetical protein HR
MHLRSPVLASVLALKASAFLVPFEVTKTGEDIRNEIASAFFAKTGRTVDLDCPGCPFFGVEDTSELQYGVENKIHLEFNVDSDNSLTVNGVSIVPKKGATATPFVPLAAPQIRVEDGEQTEPILLDFAYERLPAITSDDESDKIIIHPTRLTILGLQGIPVKVDELAIDLLQTDKGTSIARIANIPFQETPGATTCDNTSSKWSLCRLRAIIAARLQSLKEAAKAGAHATKGWVHGGKGCKGRKMGAQGMHHHGHGHHNTMGGHHDMHRFGHALHQTLRFFVIPALLGVIGGLTASAIGMLLGQLISYLWIKFHRNGRRGHASDVQVVEIVVDEDEKDALLIDGELPPPPQYEDVEHNNGDTAVDSPDQKH